MLQDDGGGDHDVPILRADSEVVDLRDGVGLEAGLTCRHRQGEASAMPKACLNNRLGINIPVGTDVLQHRGWESLADRRQDLQAGLR